MQIGSATTNSILTWLTVTVFGALAGHGYVTVASGTIPPEVLQTWPGLRTGATIAGLFSGFEIFAMRGPVGARLRRRAFLTALFIRGLVHTAIVVSALLSNRIITGLLIGHFPLHAFRRELLQDVVYSFLVVALILFVLQMRALIGGRTLLNVVLGRYHRPVREQRIFLLIDLIGSTPLAGKIGDERFHEFLSAFFLEIDAAVTQFDGEIYSYVGDAMIASWPLREPKYNVKAVEAIFAARGRLAHREPWFKARFGEAPRFRAVLHGGPIVAGECGDSRRQITYLGDVLNTTARLEALSKQLGIDNMISRHLLDQLTLPDGIAAEEMGCHQLRGVVEPMAVNALITVLRDDNSA